MGVEMNKNIKVESHSQNNNNPAEYTDYADGSKKTALGTTSQRKVPPKNEISITCTQRKWVAYLYEQYGLKTPGWLRQKLRLNQRRVKNLNDVFWEATVDGDYCGRCNDTDDWSYHMHHVWHLANGVELCK